MSADKPRYCCAVIEDTQNRLLLQLRPADAVFASGLMTCFGGAREQHESAEACLQREIAEELACQIRSSRPQCDLYRDGEWIARFYHCDLDRLPTHAVEPGHIAVWAPWSSLPGLPVSHWHALVLQAIRAGHLRVDARSRG